MLRNKKLGQIIIVFVFVAAICMQSFWWFLFDLYVDLQNSDSIEELQNVENRKMASKPNFSLYTYPEYFSDYEKYFDDNYTFRGPLISINSKIDYFVFHKSTSDEVILGEDGWLFYHDTLADYEKNNLYTEEELKGILENILVTKQYFDEIGIEFVVYVAPNKNTIYGEYMPKGVQTQEGISRTQQAVNYIKENSDVTIIYPKAELEQAKAEYPDLSLYFKLDSHWNYMGGYWGTKALLEELEIPTVPFEQVSYEEMNEPIFQWNGYDMANMLGLTGYLDEDTNYRLEGYSDSEVIYEGDVSRNLEDFNGFIRTYSNAEDKRKVYFARDSFGESMTPYLAASFGEIYSISRYAMTKTNIKEEAPDIFVYEMVERYDLGEIDVQRWAE